MANPADIADFERLEDEIDEALLIAHLMTR